MSTLSQVPEGNYPSHDQKSLGDSGRGRRAASRCFVMHRNRCQLGEAKSRYADS